MSAAGIVTEELGRYVAVGLFAFLVGALAYYPGYLRGYARGWREGRGEHPRRRGNLAPAFLALLLLSGCTVGRLSFRPHPPAAALMEGQGCRFLAFEPDAAGQPDPGLPIWICPPRKPGEGIRVVRVPR